MVYLDSSAIVKVVVAERESGALRTYLRRHPGRVSCVLARIEVLRSVRGHGAGAIARARRVLRRLDLVRLDDDLIEDAATLDADALRSLDAIHLAAARLFGDDLDALITYDHRMARAATRLGILVVSPP